MAAPARPLAGGARALERVLGTVAATREVAWVAQSRGVSERGLRSRVFRYLRPRQPDPDLAALLELDPASTPPPEGPPWRAKGGTCVAWWRGDRARALAVESRCGAGLLPDGASRWPPGAPDEEVSSDDEEDMAYMEEID